MGSEPNRLPFGNTSQDEEPSKLIPPLPEITDLVSKIKRQADKAKTVEGKVGFLDVGIEELRQIKTDGWRQYQALVDQRNLDDPEPFWNYDTDLDKAINELAIYRQRLILGQSDRNAPETKEEAPEPKPIFASAGRDPTPSTTSQTAPPLVMDIKQLALYLGCSESWLYKNYESEGMPFFLLGTSLRFRREEVEQWSRDRREARPSSSLSIEQAKPKRAARPLHQASMVVESPASPVSPQDEAAEMEVHPKTLAKIEKLAALLYEKSYLSQADSSRFRAWLLRGARRTPSEDKIAWLKQRKSLVTCIVLCHFMELVSIPETQGKKQPRPDFAAAIERDFIAEGKASLQNIDRDFVRAIDKQIKAFIEYMKTYAKRNELDFSVDNLLASSLAEYYDDIDGSEGMAVEVKEIKGNGSKLDFPMMKLFHNLSTTQAE